MVWKSTIFTALDSGFGISIVSAAFVTEGVKGTIAEKTVKFFFRYITVAGVIFTLLILKKTVTVLHFIFNLSSGSSRSVAV